jgi:hypothetical protein
MRQCAALVVACAVALLVGAQPGVGAQAECTIAAANDAVQPHLPGPDPDAVVEVYCGEFLGAGSQSMVATVRGDCFRYSGWAVFTLVGGAWQLVDGGYHAWEFHAVTVEGTTIREERPVHRRQDWYRCYPTGGSEARSWAWDGAALSAGGWTQARQAEHRAEVVGPGRRGSPQSFYVGGNAIDCGMGDVRGLRGVTCTNRALPAPAMVRMNVRGRLRVCMDSCVGNPGLGDIVNTLRRGRRLTVGRFRCRARRGAVRCVVVKSGRGFVISRDGVDRVR